MLVYAYDFVLDTDTDEYLWLNASVTGLVKTMHAVLGSVPAHAATVTFRRYTYPPQCQPSELKDVIPLGKRSHVRTATPELEPKMVLRPRYVRGNKSRAEACE